MGWTTQNDSTGTPRHYVQQDARHSCFAACLATIKRLKTGRQAPEMLGRWAAMLGENASAGGGAFREKNWETTGTRVKSLEEGVKELGLTYTRHDVAGRYFMTERCSPNRPALIQIRQGLNNYHSVVCLGTLPGTASILVLDPLLNIQEVPTATFPDYPGAPDCQFSFPNFLFP